MSESIDFINSLKDQYKLISVLSNKNGSSVMKLRHKIYNKDIVLRKNSSPILAYNIIKDFRHENLPEIYECINFDDGQVVAEEFIDGISVADVLESGKYTYNGAKTIIEGICLAMQTLHSYGIIHRDIKPENIMISNNKTVKLIDFNASRKIIPEKSNDTVVLGTIGYASPEQMGIAQCDARTDIYALGVLLNVMLTGEHPSKNLAKDRAGRIVSKCTHIDPNSRYPSAERLLHAL